MNSGFKLLYLEVFQSWELKEILTWGPHKGAGDLDSLPQGARNYWVKSDFNSWPALWQYLSQCPCYRLTSHTLCFDELSLPKKLTPNMTLSYYESIRICFLSNYSSASLLWIELLATEPKATHRGWKVKAIVHMNSFDWNQNFSHILSYVTILLYMIVKLE